MDHELIRLTRRLMLTRQDRLLPSRWLPPGDLYATPEGWLLRVEMAGVAPETISVAVASIDSGRPTRADTAMTGEITLSGLVLPVGGVKEKVLAARRAGLKRVILPRQNATDLDDLPETVREEMEFVLADRIDDVLRTAIPDLLSEAESAKQAGSSRRES